MSTPIPAVDAQGVSQVFGDVRAVDDVTLTIPTGQIMSLLGPNGAGKTTFLDMVLGFTKPADGHITVLGTSPHQAVRRGKVGAVPQSGALLQDLTVEGTMAYVASCHRQHLPSHTLLDRVGLAPLAKRKVKALSGGERQRLRFALALLPDPELLILDEPTVGMDVSIRAQFWETMHAEATLGRTIIFATHYLQEAAQFADWIVLMKKGRIHTQGTVRELTESAPRTVSGTWTGVRPACEVAAAFHAQLSGTLDPRAGEIATFDICGSSDALVSALLAEDLARDVEVTRASLDRVFLELTDDTNERSLP